MTGENKANAMLLDAITDGDIDAVQSALTNGADPGHDHHKPLLLAAENGHAEIVKLLVGHGADVHALNDAALRRAVHYSHAATVEVLLRLGADSNADGGDALIYAVNGGKTQLVASLLASGADPHVSFDLPLRRAAFQGDLANVKELIDYGADPFAQGSSALSMAVSQHHGEVAAYLFNAMEIMRKDFKTGLAEAADKDMFLHASWRGGKEAALLRAVQMSCLGQALDAMKAAGKGLCGDDLLTLKSAEGHTLLDLAVQRNELRRLFDPRFWNGKFDEMAVLLQGLTPAQQKAGGLAPQDMEDIIGEYHRSTAEKNRQLLKAQAPRFRPKP